MSGDTNAVTIYTCPMHPQIQQDHPGACPLCGMALEPMTATAGPDAGVNAELNDMTRRFWIGAALSLPVFVLAMAHLIPVLPSYEWTENPRAGHPELCHPPSCWRSIQDQRLRKQWRPV